jgi:hypothetical protein
MQLHYPYVLIIYIYKIKQNTNFKLRLYTQNIFFVSIKYISQVITCYYKTDLITHLMCFGDSRSCYAKKSHFYCQISYPDLTRNVRLSRMITVRGLRDRAITENGMVSPRQQNRYDVKIASVLLQILADNLLIQNGCCRRQEPGR